MVSLRWYRMSREQKQKARNKPAFKPVRVVLGDNVLPHLPPGRVTLPADDYFTDTAA